MTEAEIIRRGEAARAFRDNPLTVDLFAEVERETMEQWALSQPPDTVERESCYFQLRVLGALKSKLANWAYDGAEAMKRRTNNL